MNEEKPPPLGDQLESLYSFIMKSEEWEVRLDNLLGVPLTGPPRCEQSIRGVKYDENDKIIVRQPVQKMAGKDCRCDECIWASHHIEQPLRRCYFCHYAYFELPSETMHGLHGQVFVRCPACGKQHVWSLGA